MSRFKPKRRATTGRAGGPGGLDSAAAAAQAERLLREGQGGEAERLCRAILAKEPNQPLALMITSVVCLSSGRHAEAETLLRYGASAHPLISGFQAALGRLLLESGRPAEALVPLENCVLLEPEQREHRLTLIKLYQTRLFASFSEVSRLAMLACLADPALTHSSMQRAWLSLLRLDPDAARLFELFERCPNYVAFAERLSPDHLSLIREHELLQRGLERFLAADVSIERGLTWLRRWFAARPEHRVGQLSLLCGLARYCFFTEFVFHEAEPWTHLRADTETAESLALLACYQPLAHTLTDRDLPRLNALSNEPCYRALLRASLEEPLLELRVRETIPTLTPISDPLSRAVREQYEENPYPRWATVGSATTGQGAAAGAGHDKRILIAGCGTGREAVQAALSYPESRVEAFDLSRASLAYGMRKAAERELRNLSFAQADLLELGAHPRRYDLIIASGVLHHLREPQAGLRALLRLLRSRGILRIGLYSRLARRPLVEARRFIEQHGYTPSPTGIRAFRAALEAGALSEASRAWLTRSYDFYCLSPCRDLLFHVQEHDFTLPEVGQLLASFELAVLHVELKSPLPRATYQQRFPNDPNATQLENWAVLEAQEPNLFVGMYDLWLCRASEQRELDPSWLGV